jgi:hypothetical protein
VRSLRFNIKHSSEPKIKLKVKKEFDMVFELRRSSKSVLNFQLVTDRKNFFLKL